MSFILAFLRVKDSNRREEKESIVSVMGKVGVKEKIYEYKNNLFIYFSFGKYIAVKPNYSEQR